YAAIERLGLTFEIENEIVKVDADLSVGEEQLQAGDLFKKIRLLTDVEELPEYLRSSLFEEMTKQLVEGHELKEDQPLTSIISSLRYFPVGTRFEILATRPTSGGEVISAELALGSSNYPAMYRGIVLSALQRVRTADSIGDALGLGVREGKRRFGDVLKFLTLVPQGKVRLKQVAGPVGIATIAKSSAEQGISKVFLFLTMLSMNLAILNFLPIPALDGGHMVFLTYEAVMGRRANEQVEFKLTVAGVLALLTLMVVVVANDLVRLFG
ncbi:MAG: site-2 protease family protein, partial [Planctomycetota bacterium]